MSKHDAASNTNYLFEGYSYKFPKMTQELVFDKFGGYGNSYAKSSAGNTTSICLKYGHTN
jgi:hypothetical protein